MGTGSRVLISSLKCHQLKQLCTLGQATTVVVGVGPRAVYPRIRPQCVHTMLMPPLQTRPLRCCVMGGGTPIYDQVRGERINAEVPPSAATPQRVDDHGRHRVRPDTPVSAAVFGPPGPGADLAWSYHCRAGTDPADLPTADGPPQATTWEPQAALPRQVHTRQAPRHAANNPPASVTDRNPATREAAAGDRGATATPTSAHHVALTSTLFSRR